MPRTGRLHLGEERPPSKKLERLFGEGKRRAKIISRFTSESRGMMLFFAVLVDASAGWHGVRMPAHITARLQQMAEHPDSEWEDPDLMKLAARDHEHWRSPIGAFTGTKGLDRKLIVGHL